MTLAKEMKNRRKILIVAGILILVAIAIVPVRPKYGDRPFISHRQWEQDADEIANLLSAYEHKERESSTRMIQINVDQLTGLNGYSILGAPGLFGRRSVSVIGYVTEQDASQFYREEDVIWIGTEDIPKLRKITKES